MTERFSKIISFEPALRAANEKFAVLPALWVLRGIDVFIYLTWVAPRITFVPCLG